MDPARSQADALCGVIAGIHRRGWCEGTGGNFSYVQREQPLELLMAPSGVDKGALQPDDLIVVDGNGAVIEGAGKASAETQLHLAIVTNTGAKAVLHTHSQSATLLSRHACPPGRLEGEITITGLEMLKGLEGITTHTSAITVPVLANDQDLARLSLAATPQLERAPYGLLIAGHGLYAWGASLASAKRHLEILEFLLEQSWRERLLESSQRGSTR